MAIIVGDVVYALRVMRRSKGFSFAVLLSTSLGVGATASIFSLIDAFLLRPLPVPDTSRVVRLASLTEASPVGRFSYAEIDDIGNQAQSFAGLFYRNCFNLGLPAIVCADAGRIRLGDVLEIDFQGFIKNKTTGETLKCESIPPHLQQLVRDGGLVPYLEKRLKRA